MADGKKKSTHPLALIIGPMAGKTVWIAEPDGTTPVKCCFTVKGNADAGSYIHVSVSQVAGAPINDPRPSYTTADDNGIWSTYICVPTPPPLSAGTIIRVRACIVNPSTGADAACMDIPVALTSDCPSIS